MLCHAFFRGASSSPAPLRRSASLDSAASRGRWSSSNDLCLRCCWECDTQRSQRKYLDSRWTFGAGSCWSSPHRRERQRPASCLRNLRKRWGLNMTANWLIKSLVWFVGRSRAYSFILLKGCRRPCSRKWWPRQRCRRDWQPSYFRCCFWRGLHNCNAGYRGLIHWFPRPSEVNLLEIRVDFFLEWRWHGFIGPGRRSAYRHRLELPLFWQLARENK